VLLFSDDECQQKVVPQRDLAVKVRNKRLEVKLMLRMLVVGVRYPI